MKKLLIGFLLASGLAWATSPMFYTLPPLHEDTVTKNQINTFNDVVAARAKICQAGITVGSTIDDKDPLASACDLNEHISSFNKSDMQKLSTYVNTLEAYLLAQINIEEQQKGSPKPGFISPRLRELRMLLDNLEARITEYKSVTR